MLDYILNLTPLQQTLLYILVLVLLFIVPVKTYVPIRNFLETHVCKKIKPIRKYLIKRHIRKSGYAPNGISRRQYLKHLKAAQDLSVHWKRDTKHLVLGYFHYYKVCLYKKIVDGANEYVKNRIEKPAQRLYNEKSLRNRIVYKIPFIGDFQRDYDDKRRYVVDMILEKKDEFCRLINKPNPTDELFELFLENYDTTYSAPSPNEKKNDNKPLPKNKVGKLPAVKSEDIFDTNMYNRFHVLESWLRQDGYLSEEKRWKESKKDMVIFILKLMEYKYFLPDKDLEIRRFFEHRYDMEMGQQFEASKRAPLRESKKYKKMFRHYPFIDP